MAVETVVFGGQTVLLIEDHPDVSKAYGAVLESLGLRALHAADGHRALDLWRAERARVALVVTDHAMPGMNGAELVTALRREGCSAPVIMLSGYPQPSEIAGVSAWLQKPCAVEEFVAVVARLLPGSRKRGQ